MELIFELLSQLVYEYSYLFVFVIIFILSIIPVLTPPTWMIIVAVYTTNNTLDPIILSVIGASAATLGRLILLRFSVFGRKIISVERKKSIEKLKNYLERKRYGYFVGTLIFSLTPLPSNMLFISYGLMNVKTIGIIIGFWLGRFIVYNLMIFISINFLKSITNYMDNDLTATIILDTLGIIMTLCILFIDWNKLIMERKLRVIKPIKIYNMFKQFRKSRNLDKQ